jgi:hypothetical protein
VATTLNINTGGVLTLASANRIGDATAVFVDAGRLVLGGNDTVSSFTQLSGGALAGTGTLSAATYLLQGGTVDANLGLGTATVNTGVTNLNGSLAALSVGISGGSLVLGSTTSLAGGATVSVSGGTLSTAGFDNTILTLNLSGGVVAGSGILTASTYALTGGEVAGNLGAGIANVNGAVSLTGTTAATTLNINTGGVLTLASANRIGDSTAVVVDAGRLVLGGNDTVATFNLLSGGSLAGTGTLSVGGAFMLEALDTCDQLRDHPAWALSGTEALRWQIDLDEAITGEENARGAALVEGNDAGVSHGIQSSRRMGQW